MRPTCCGRPGVLHAGSPDHASGGLMLPILAATLHGFGLPVVAGGADNFVGAFEALLTELRVDIRTGQPVERILVTAGRATGVVAGGEPPGPPRPVLASVTPSALYGELLPPDAPVPPVVRDQARRFRHGRAAMQIHVALSAPPTWNDDRLAAVPLLHFSDGSASTAIACAEAEAGLLPRRSTVVVGQRHVLDPSRVPEGARRRSGSSCRSCRTSRSATPPANWTSAAAGPRNWPKSYTLRALARVARHAPDLNDKVLAWDAVTPADLAAYNPNAVAGDPYGGSAELDQNLLWRPLPSAARHATPVPGLWQIGASTHPGPGLGGGSGHLVAQQLIRGARRRITRR
ncbi:Pyridine nucleotide-disulfide oxidoreductase domain-containing protein 2 OS=Streptomyces alboniger OX=132473 GN=CP975_03565 PE=4 SV=1 [Streptomyces alboniger]